MDLLGSVMLIEKCLHIKGFKPAIEDFSAGQVRANLTAIGEIDFVAEHPAANIAFVVSVNSHNDYDSGQEAQKQGRGDSGIDLRETAGTRVGIPAVGLNLICHQTFKRLPLTGFLRAWLGEVFHDLKRLLQFFFRQGIVHQLSFEEGLVSGEVH